MTAPRPTPLDFFRIMYVVPHTAKPITEASPFQGFSQGVLDTSHYFGRIATLPQNIYELFAKRDDLLIGRMIGRSYWVLPLELEAFEYLFSQPIPPFCCICSPMDAVQRVQEIIEALEQPILHVTPPKSGIGLPFDQFHRRALVDFAGEVLRYWERTQQFPGPASTLRISLESGTNDEVIPIDLPRHNHLVVLPNEATLEAMRFSLTEGDILIGHENTPYFEAIRKSIAPIVSERQRILSELPGMRMDIPYDLILTAPSLYKWIGKQKQTRPRKDKTDTELLWDAVNLLSTQNTYNFLVTARTRNLFFSPPGQAVLQIRREEIAAYTAAIAVRASSNIIPVIRLPPSVNGIQGELTSFRQAVRIETPRQPAKLSKIARRLSAALRGQVPDWIFEQIESSVGGVKLIADAPLEWLPLRDLPLMLRRNCSRIPTTPGNLFIQETLLEPESRMTPEAFSSILVIRSFQPNDKIRLYLEHAVRKFERESENGPSVTFVDVANEDELISAIEKFDGALMIFDGHGFHSPHTDIGTLRIGQTDVDAWRLRGRVRIPPIVILSACDTFPFAGSHASTANGFLTAGAATVIGTSLPVAARRSAILVGRMIFRIAAYIPFILKRPNHLVRWSEIFPGLQRMMWVTEVKLALEAQEDIHIDNESWLRIGYLSNTAINSGRDDWFEITASIIAEELKMTDENVRELILRNAYITDALRYVQLGNPEGIIIHAHDVYDLGSATPEHSSTDGYR